MLSVLIATTNRANQLKTTLRSLAACHPPPFSWQAIIVENGRKCGAEGVVKIMQEKLPIRYLYHPWANKSNALNYALPRLNGGLIVFSDDDITYDRMFLAGYARECGGLDRGVYFGGLFEPIFEGPQPAGWLRPFLPPSVTGEGVLADGWHFPGCNWAAFSEDIIEAGGFDVRLGPGSKPRAVGQETDMQLRLLSAGCKSQFISEAVVYHRVSQENTGEAFALRRIHWGGVRDGLIRRSGTGGIKGVARRVAKESFKWAAKQVLGRPHPSIFRSAYDLAYASGYLKGRLFNVLRPFSRPRPLLTYKEQNELAYWVQRQRLEKVLADSNKHYVEFFTTHFGLHVSFYDGKAILDIGCGPRGSLEWADMATERVGLDPLADKYQQLGTSSHKMRYVQACSENMPFPDNYFDVVSSFNSLDHVDDLDATVVEIKRVLKWGGMFLLLTDVNHKATSCEPQEFSWNIAEKFKPEFELLEKRHYEKRSEGMYASLRAGILYDEADLKERYGILSAKWRKVGGCGSNQ